MKTNFKYICSVGAFALLLGAGIACTEEEPIYVPPTFKLSEVSDIMRTTARFSGSISGDVSKVREYGFEYSTTEEFTSSTTQKVIVGDSAVSSSYDAIVRNLEANERYYYRMFASTGASKVYSQAEYFQTAASSAPLLTSFVVDSIGENLARFKCTIEDVGDEYLIEYGVGYKTQTDKAYIPIPSDSIIPGTNNTYFVEINGLEPATKYSFRPYAKNSADAFGATGSREGYGEVLDSQTESLLSADVTTSEIMDGHIGINSIEVSGTFNGAAGSNDIINSCGFCWSENNMTPVITDDTLKLDPVRVGETFYATIKNLKPKTLYYVRAYASNTVNGVERFGYGDIYEVTTGGLKTPILEFEREEHEEGWWSILYETTATSIHIKATITNYDANALVEKGLIWDEVDGSITLDKAKENKTFLSLDTKTGGKTIDGTIQNLKMDTRYYVRGYAVYRAEGIEVIGYTGEQNIHTNNFEAPNLETTEIKDITRNSATLVGGMSNKGNGEITEKGFVAIKRNVTYQPKLTDEGAIIIKSDDDTFTEELKNLEYQTRYAVRTYAIAKLEERIDTVYAWYNEFSTLSLGTPQFRDIEITQSSDTLTLSSGLDETGDGKILERGFYWRVDTIDTEFILENDCQSIKAEGNNEKFSAVAAGFKYGNSYRISSYVKTFVDNDTVVHYRGGWYHHWMGGVQTPNMKNIEHTSSSLSSITVKGGIENPGVGKIVEKGFIWIKNPEDGNWKYPTFEEDNPDDPHLDGHTGYKAVTDGTNEEYSFEITGLEKACNYFVCAYAKMSYNGQEYISYSNTNHIGTQDYNMPNFGNMNVPYDSIGFSKALFQTSFNSLGNVSIIKKGFVVHMTNVTWEPTLGNKLYQLEVEGDQFVAELTDLKVQTQYIVRAYATCKVGEEEKTIYSDGQPFSTRTPQSTRFNNMNYVSDSTTVSSLYLTCGIGETGDGTLVEKGFIWKQRPENSNSYWQYPSFDDKATDENDGNTGYQVIESDSIQSYSYKMTGLKASTTYFVRSYAKMKVEDSTYVYYSDITDPTTSSVKSTEMKNIEYVSSSLSSITVKSGIQSRGNGTLVERGFIWIEDPDTDDYWKYPRFEEDIPDDLHHDGYTGYKAVTDGTDEEFSLVITGLNKNQHYFISSYVKMNYDGKEYISYSSTGHWSTEDYNMPNFGNMSVNNDSIGFSTALLQTSFNSLGNLPIVKKGFVIHLAETTSEPSLGNKLYQLDVEGDEFKTKVTGLNHNTRYAVRAYATCKTGETEETVYSGNRTFTTDRPGNVRFNNLVNVGDSTTLNTLYYTCGIAEVPDGEVIEKGFIWKERPKNNHSWHEPSFEDHPDNESDGYTGYQAVESDSLQSYAFKMTGLKASTTYYVRSYAKVKVEEEIYTFYSGTSGNGTSGLSVNLEFSPALDSCMVSGNVGALPAGVEEFGICYALDTDINTPIEDMTTKVKAEKAADFDESGKFTASIGNLTSNEEYKVGFYFILNGEEIRLDSEWWFNTKRAPSINDNVSPGKQGDE